MQKHIVFALCGYLLSFGICAQTNQPERVLREIEQNNKELQAFQAFIKSQQLEFRTTNNLPDPQVSAFYLPFGTHSTSDYTEFQISQSLEFPSVYPARKNLTELQGERLMLEYNRLRQAILLPAKKYYLELIYLYKQKDLEQSRTQQARRIFNQVQELYEKEQLGILELNKAKVAWMQDQFVVDQIENEIRNTFILLQKLNGGKAVDFDQAEYTAEPGLAPLDTLWQEKTAIDPELKVLEGNEAVALQQIKLSRNKILPNLTAGYNYQGLLGVNYSGVYGGLSIPLWNSRNKIKAAKAQYQYQQSHKQAVGTEVYALFQEQYNQYQLMLLKFREYESTLEGLNSESLLFQAYQLGEISFMEYYVELQFYRQAYNKMLQMEKELNQLKAELLKHQL